MPIGLWWLRNDVAKKVMDGPFLWDGVTPWDPPNNLTPVTGDPLAGGYTWTATPASGDFTAQLADIQTRMAALEGRVQREAHGAATIPAIANALGGTVTARVTLRQPVRNSAGVITTNYTAQAILIPGVVLGTLKVTATTNVDAQNVDVTVQSSGLITLGQATVLVFADANT